METIVALWQVVTSTEGGKLLQKLFIQLFTVPKIWLKKVTKNEVYFCSVICMVIQGNTTYSCMGAITRNNPRRQEYSHTFFKKSALSLTMTHLGLAFRKAKSPLQESLFTKS